LAGYGFIELKTHKDADRIMRNFNLQPMGQTRKIFKLNWASQTTVRDPNITSVFISELGTEVTEDMVMNTFKSIYPSVKSVKIHFDNETGMSKCYGFVRFGTSDEAQHAVHIMQGKMIGSHPIKLFLTNKNDAASRQMAPTGNN
jgi:RNA recognition motif-containing protein